MAGNMQDNGELRAKILIERYKLYSDKRKYCMDELKYCAWLDTTFIALNAVSISSEKLYGVISVVSVDMLRVLCAVNILMITYGLIKIIALINYNNKIDFNITNKDDPAIGNDYSWKHLSAEVKLAFENDTKAIASINTTVSWSFRWLSRGLGINALVLILPLLPYVSSWIRGIFS